MAANRSGASATSGAPPARIASSACSIDLAVGALGAARGLLEQHDALGQLAREILLAGADLALELVAPGREDVAPGLDRPLPAAHRVDVELALPAHAVDVGVDRAQRRLHPAAAARRLVAHDRPQDLVAVAEDVGGDAHRVAHDALGGVAPAVDRRRGQLDDDARGGALAIWYRHRAGSIPLRAHQTSRDRSTTFQRRAAAPHLTARRPPRPGRLRLGRLARRGRPAVVADAAARPAGPPPLALQGGLRVRRLARPAGGAWRARSRRPRSSTSASASRRGSRTGRASARAGRSPTRSASTASGPRCARTRPSAA